LDDEGRVPETSFSPSRVVLALLLTLTTLGFCCASSASASIQLGAYVAAPGQVGAPEDAAVMDDWAEAVGRRPDIVMDYSNFTDPVLTEREVENISSRGAVPLVSWQLFESGWSGPTVSLAAIAQGSYDDALIRAADEARSMPFREIMIRFGHEMNGNWYGWSGDPANFIAAWRHVVTVFRNQGADNVKWVWSPNVDNGSYPFDSYFPGDEWVDYVGLDGYNWGTGGQGVNQWQGLDQVFGSSYDDLARLSSRPVIITEIGCSESGGDKAAWIRDGFLKTIPNRFPRVRAVIWFNRDMEQDWRVESSRASLAAYREVVASTLYGGDVPPSDVPEVKRLRVAIGSGAARRERVRGGRVVFRLSDSASVTLSLATAAGSTVRGANLTVRRSAGRGSVGLRRLAGGHRLRAGVSYLVVATASSSQGIASRPRKTVFRVGRRESAAGIFSARRAR
jgi:hypothetical protein